MIVNVKIQKTVESFTKSKQRNKVSKVRLIPAPKLQNASLITKYSKHYRFQKYKAIQL